MSGSGRVDLDAVLAHLGNYRGCGSCKVRDLVAEVNASRAALDLAPRPPTFEIEDLGGYLRAIVDYDLFVRGTQPGAGGS